MNKKEAVVLISGGRDSLLSSCMVIEQGYKIFPIICNNGHIEGVNRAMLAVMSLKKKYGDDKVSDLIQCNTGMTLLSYIFPIWHETPKKLIEKYPDLPIYQVHCLTCKIAMYVHVLAFCRANSVNYLVDGMRKSQGFFVDLNEMKEQFNLMCLYNDVKLITPVYDIVSDYERKRMLCDRGMTTKTLEPQCFLGCPLKGSLSKEECECLIDFFENELFDFALQDIIKLINSKKYN